MCERVCECVCVCVCHCCLEPTHTYENRTKIVFQLTISESACYISLYKYTLYIYLIQVCVYFELLLAFCHLLIENQKEVCLDVFLFRNILEKIYRLYRVLYICITKRIVKLNHKISRFNLTKKRKQLIEKVFLVFVVDELYIDIYSI